MTGGIGIVVLDLAGGDAAYYFVDEERWAQIVAAHAAIDDSVNMWGPRFTELVGWLTGDESPEYTRPEGAPDRAGRLIKCAFTQTFVLEDLGGVQGRLLGILTLP